VVETGRTTDLPVHLILGSVQQTVEVKGATTALETTSNQVADTVRNDYVQNLPLGGRDTLPFALLSAGTTTSGAGASTFNGLPEASLNISLDGINNNDQRYKSGSQGFSEKAPLRLDAIDEVTVATTGTEADTAAGGAMQIRFTTKRGTDKYHGKVFEELRNDDLNANGFFNNARGLPIAKVRLNDAGGQLGRPLPIPVSFLKHKLFFFVNYEQLPASGTSGRSGTDFRGGIWRSRDATRPGGQFRVYQWHLHHRSENGSGGYFSHRKYQQHLLLPSGGQ
jgi:hypothetical protein